MSDNRNIMAERTLNYQRLSPTAMHVRAALPRSDLWSFTASISLMLLAPLSMLFAPSQTEGSGSGRLERDNTQRRSTLKPAAGNQAAFDRP